MQAKLGNLALLLGTVLGGIAAANSQKAGRQVALADDLSGQYLLQPVEVDGKVLAEAGRELDPVLTTSLRTAGVDEVIVSTPPKRQLTIPVTDPELVGRRLVDALSYGEDKSFAAGSFLDAERVATLAAAGVAEVTVQNNKVFAFADWEMKWLFFGAIALMVGGVALKRAAPVEAPVSEDGSPQASGPAALKAIVAGLVEKVDELAGRVDGLDPDDIHQAVDPLLADMLPFVEGRQHLSAAYGGKGFAAIMGHFASGERKLNRAWSAAVDGYPEEARKSVKAAAPYFHDALTAFPS